jgi:hypothetical protein
MLLTSVNASQELTNPVHLPLSPMGSYPPGSIVDILDASQDPSPSDRLGDCQSSGTTFALAPSDASFDGHPLPFSGDVNILPHLPYPQVGLLRTSAVANLIMSSIREPSFKL